MSKISFALLLAALTGCAAPSATCSLAKVGDFPVTYLHGQPVITIQVAGHNQRMLVDTGADNTMLTPAAYNALNLGNAVSVAGYYGEGMGGTVQINSAILEDLTIGPVRLKDEDIMVIDFESVTKDGKPGADGLLGFDVLRSFDVGLDLPNHLISLYIPQGCATDRTPWAGDYAVMPYVSRPGHLSRPVIPIQVDMQVLTALIDTGAFDSLVTEPALINAGVAAEAAPTRFTHIGLGIGNRPFAFRREQFASVGIGAELISNGWLNVASHRLGPEDDIPDGVLGGTYLAHHRVFLANDTRRAYLGVTTP